MKNVVIILTLTGFAALFLFCGGSSEVSRADQEYYDYDNLFPEEESEPEPVRETVQPTTTFTEPPPPPVEEVIYFEDINFDYDKYDLTMNARDILSRHASKLKDRPNVKILIEGHCDERGTIEYNLALGEKRATAVQNYLENYGISVQRLNTISYGKERPLDPRHTEDAWAQNRRAAFIILSK